VVYIAVVGVADDFNTTVVLVVAIVEVNAVDEGVYQGETEDTFWGDVSLAVQADS
jgi:hypothetical protein